MKLAFTSMSLGAQANYTSYSSTMVGNGAVYSYGGSNTAAAAMSGYGPVDYSVL